MKHCVAIAIALFVVSSPMLAPGAEPMLRNARDVAQAAFYEPAATNRVTFHFAGRVTYIREAHDSPNRIIAVEDATGAVALTEATDNPDCESISPGDLVEFYGRIRRPTSAIVRHCRVLSSGPQPKPTDSNITDLLDGCCDFRLASFTGTLRDVAESETAPRWLILVVCDRRDRMFVSVPDTPGTKDRLVGLVGRRVAATGVCLPKDPSRRTRVGRTFKVADGEDVHLVEGESSSPVPDIADIRFARPMEILALGRHSATGRVVAVWQGKHALIDLGRNGNVAGLEFADGIDAPRYGDFIMAVGLPESDLYRINLTNVKWTKIAAPDFKRPEPVEVSANSICTNVGGYKIVRNVYHGCAISLRGIVRSLSTDESHRMHVECNGLLVPVDTSSLESGIAEIDIGCTVKVSGTCVVSQENRRQSAAFPRMDGFIVVLRSPDDIAVLARPPWWTPRKLMIVIGGLLAALLGIIIANWLQRRKTALMAKFATDLKVGERTRLAVELHDSLAQNLTGVSLEIDTAGKLAETDPKAMREHLGQATRTLKSCRDELRNCIWDLRNRALEESSMDDAIRQTLAPHVVGVEVAIRFNVPRDRISDNTTHAILRSIRELTINAVRHGKATKIWIAGSIDGDNLLFSVRDNGTGFDPATAPGFAEGHYGIVGITERVEALEGDFNIESTPGNGAKATVKINLSP